MRIVFLLLLAGFDHAYANPAIFSNERSCGTRIDMATVVQAAQQGFAKGLACLAALPRTETTETHLKKLRSMSSVRLTCDVPSDNDLSRILAQGHADVLGGTVRLNPSWVSEGNFNEVGTTFFHETFHLIGHYHFTGIEYAYSCEECCFRFAGDSKSVACRICSGKFDEKGDSAEYVKLLNKFMGERGSPNQAYGRVFRILAQEPGRFLEVLPQLEDSLLSSSAFAIGLTLYSVSEELGISVSREPETLKKIQDLRRFFSSLEKVPQHRALLKEFLNGYLQANSKWVTLVEPVANYKNDPDERQWERFRRALFSSGLASRFVPLDEPPSLTGMAPPEAIPLNTFLPDWAAPAFPPPPPPKK